MSNAVPVGFERWEPGSPWGDVVYSDGSKIPVDDRDGAIEAETKAFGARHSAQPQVATPPYTQAPLTGAASPLPMAPPDEPQPPPPPPPPPRPVAPAAPPMPATAPLSPAEKAPLLPTPGETAALSGAPGNQDSARPGSAPATPAADVLAKHGVLPGPAAAPAAPPMTPAEESIRALAPGLLPAGASVQAQGVDAQSAADIRGTALESLALKGKGINQQLAATERTLQDDSAAANQAYFDAWKARNQALGEEAATTRARDEASSRLSEAQARPIQPHVEYSDWGAAITMLGAIAGGIAQNFGSAGRNSTLDMIHQMNREWVETQKVNKSALVTDLERVLGDKNAALSMAQSRIKSSLADEAESRKRFARNAGAMRELESTASTLRAQALDDYNKAQALVMGRVATSVNFAPQATGPGEIKLDNPVTRELASLGITPDAWTKGLNGKVREGENSPTIAQAATATKQIEADLSLLESLAAANGGTLPTKGVLNVPQALVPVMSRLGWKAGMAADEATAIINTYVTQKAKSYGGVITESDRESAIKEMGASGDSFISALRRMRDSQNNGIRTSLSQQFPGVGQHALDILLRDSGSYEGMPSVKVAPFEKQNVAETGPASKPMQENPALGATDADRARIDAELTARREEEERKRAEREAEVARRRERPIPGSKL